MRFFFYVLFLALVLACLNAQAREPAAAPSEDPAEAEDLAEWETDWRGWDGFHYKRIIRFPKGKQVKNKEGVVRLDYSQVAHVGKMGGKLFLDGAGFSGDESAVEKGGDWEVRKARVYAEGNVVLLIPFSYSVEAGFAGGDFHLEDTYFQLEKRPWVGRIRIGQFTAPMGLEATSSSFDNLFMESSGASAALAPGSSVGLMIGKPIREKRMTWSLALMAPGVGEENFDASKNYIRVTARFTGLAVDKTTAEVPEWLHLGISTNLQRSSTGETRYRSRPESHLAPYLVDTGDLDAKNASTGCLEAAWVKGPCSIQGEYFHTGVSPDTGMDLRFDGWYIQGSWFPTGESRPYKKSSGVLGRVRPLRPFSFKGGGKGAVELTLRYSFVDLTDGLVRGGAMRCLAAGLNWDLNPNARVRLNYVTSRVDRMGVESRVRILQIRMGFRF